MVLKILSCSGAQVLILGGTGTHCHYSVVRGVPPDRVPRASRCRYAAHQGVAAEDALVDQVDMSMRLSSGEVGQSLLMLQGRVGLLMLPWYKGAWGNYVDESCIN